MKKQLFLTNFPLTVFATSKRKLQARIRKARERLIASSISGYALLFDDALPSSFLATIDPTQRQRSFGHIPVMWAGLPPYMKYQNEGGPSLAQCFDLVRDISSTPAPDILNFLDSVTFNFLIGNNDAHGKNFSFLYESESGRHTARLAPLYDLVSTSHYPELSPNMAMEIGSRYASHQVSLRHWQALWQAAKVSENAAQKRTLRFAEELAETLSKLLASQEVENPVQEEISKAIASRTRRLISSLS